MSSRKRSLLSQLFWLIFLFYLWLVTRSGLWCSGRSFCSLEKVDFLLGYHQFNWITFVFAKKCLGLRNHQRMMEARVKGSQIMSNALIFFGPFRSNFVTLNFEFRDGRHFDWCAFNLSAWSYTFLSSFWGWQFESAVLFKIFYQTNCHLQKVVWVTF